MFDDKSLIGPGMKDARFWEPVVGQLHHRLPCRAILLTAPLECAPPEIGDMVTECHDGPTVGRNRVVIEEAGDDLLEPFALLGSGIVHAPSQFLLDFPKLGPHTVAAAVPQDEELADACLAADEGEAQEVEGLRFSKPALLATLRRKAAELDQAGLFRMKR